MSKLEIWEVPHTFVEGVLYKFTGWWPAYSAYMCKVCGRFIENGRHVR